MLNWHQTTSLQVSAVRIRATVVQMNAMDAVVRNGRNGLLATHPFRRLDSSSARPAARCFSRLSWASVPEHIAHYCAQSKTGSTINNYKQWTQGIGTTAIVLELKESSPYWPYEQSIASIAFHCVHCVEETTVARMRRADTCGDAKRHERQTIHMRSGAEMPRIARPFRMTVRDARASTSRARVISGGSLST